jgi:hypothetical protein
VSNRTGTAQENVSLLQEKVSQKDGSQKESGERSNPFTWFRGALLARSGLVAYLPIIIGAILMYLAASWQIFWTTTDAARYQCYALTFWLGSRGTTLLPPTQCLFLHLPASPQPLFHLLPAEYPPLTLLIFSLSLPAPLHYYQVLFAVWMALTALLIYWLLMRYGPRGAAFIFVLYCLLGAWATAEGRFDLVPAALTLLCVIAADRKHWTWAYVALAFGVLLKLYPILFLPALFIAEQRDAQRFHTPPSALPPKSVPLELWHSLRGAYQWRWRNALIFFGILLGATGGFALLDFHGAFLSQFSYFAQRPIQVESTGSMFLWLGTFFGFPIQIVFTYGSINILSDIGGIVSLTSEVFFVLGYVYIFWLQWRGKLDLLQTIIALLLVFMATGKVFSPQYLIWIIPLLAYSSPLDRFWLFAWGTISLLTTIIYPYLYIRTPHTLLAPLLPGFSQTVAIRNICFVLLTLAYLFNWFQARRRKPLAEKS